MNKYQKLAISLSLGLSLIGCGELETQDIDTLPVALDDTAKTTQNANEIIINVLSNDTPIGELNISSVEIITPPQHGKYKVKNTGEVEYKPNTNYHGTDSLIYTVKDTKGNFSNPATVTITVELVAFIIKIDTTIPITFASGGSGNDRFQIPTDSVSTYDYNVDCGDGSPIVTNITSSHTCNYVIPGKYEISITGTFPHILFPNPPIDNEKLLSIEQWGTQKWQSMEHAFSFCRNMTSNATDIPDLSQVTDMSRMFLNAELFQQANIASWDVSNIEDMQYLFYGAKAFNNNITNWTVNNVTNMQNMFFNADSFNQDISAWEVDNVENMASMFKLNDAFNQDISDWKVGNVESMKQMFSSASKFNQDIGSWNVGKVTDMANMFQNVTLSITNYDALLIGWDSQSLTARNNNTPWKSRVFGGGNNITSNDPFAIKARSDLKGREKWSITDGQ